MELQISHTLRHTQKEWDFLVNPKSVEQSSAWITTVEDSGVLDMQYIFLRDNNTLTGGACCHVLNRFNGITIPFIEVGAPLGSWCSFFSFHREHTGLLLKGIEQVRTQKKAWGTVILDLREDEYTQYKEQFTRFYEFLMPDTTYIDLEFSDFDDYLDSLSSRSRRSMRNTLRKAEKWGITTVYTSKLAHWGSTASRLQGYTYKQHGETGVHLPPVFYEKLETMKGTVELVLYFKGSTPLVCALVLNTPDMCEYTFPGIDPKYAKYQAYFLLYYHGIKRALKKNKKRIYFGPTAYSFKEKIGCTREKLFGVVKMKNSLLNLGLKSYFKYLGITGKRVGF
ncbi:MAG: GNAT family N-acetyltransferase [Candidatus Methanofastidiosia archaeon]|jgi:hypothetical protein